MTTVVTQSGPIALPFTDLELTQAINLLPTPFGQFTAEGYFPAEPLASQYVEIDIENGVISALPVTADGPATMSRHEQIEARIFKIPTIKHLDSVMARDIRNMLQIAGRSKKAQTLVDLMNKRLLRLKTKFNLTCELMMTTAVKGVITDGAGSVIYDLFAAFEVEKKVVYFNLDDNTTDVMAKCDEVFELISQDLSDEVMTGITAKVSSSFFTKLINHPNVKAFYLQAEQALTLANIARGEDGGYRPRQFTLGNITFVEYPAVVPMWGGTSARIIAPGLGHAYPTGTIDTHYTYIAPAEDIRVLDGSAASVEDKIHVTTEPLKHGAGVEMQGQMNALALWRRPKLLVELHAEAGVDTVEAGGAD